jgi:hypothetical protein
MRHLTQCYAVRCATPDSMLHCALCSSRMADSINSGLCYCSHAQGVCPNVQKQFMGKITARFIAGTLEACAMLPPAGGAANQAVPPPTGGAAFRAMLPPRRGSRNPGDASPRRGSRNQGDASPRRGSRKQGDASPCRGSRKPGDASTRRGSRTTTQWSGLKRLRASATARR